MGAPGQGAKFVLAPDDASQVLWLFIRGLLLLPVSTDLSKLGIKWLLYVQLTSRCKLTATPLGLTQVGPRSVITMQDNEEENHTRSRACGTEMFAVTVAVDENQMFHSPAPQSLRPALVCVN